MTIPRPIAKTMAAVAGVSLFVILTLAFIPTAVLKDAITTTLAARGYTFRADAFAKALPLGIKGRRIAIGNDAGPLLVLDEAAIRLRLSPLLTGRLSFSVSGRIGNGTIDGSVTVAPRQAAALTVTDLPLEAVPFFSTVAGMQAKGIARVSASLDGPGPQARGTLQIQVRGAELSGIRIGETPLPDSAYREIQGMLKVGGGMATLESFSLQGDGLYVRLSGNMPLASPLAASQLNLSLELMPKPEFLERQKFVFLLLTKFQDSPGHYRIPVRGTLAKPVIMQ